ncbi:MAG: DUF3577 domain-containing protein [Pseudomonadota bacterium]
MTNQNENQYFDLVTTGIGYLSRSRTVNPTQGKPYESVSIAAIHGRSNDVNYTYFDTNVVGSDAIDFITKYKDQINDEDSKFLVRFKVGDPTPSSYTVKNGNNAGQVRHNIKARLLKITYAKLNGEVIYSEKDNEDNNKAPQPADDSKAASNDSQSSSKKDDDMNAGQSADEQKQNDEFVTWKDGLGDVVVLDRTDSDFTNKRKHLSESGYDFDVEEMHWNLKKAA